MFLGETFYSHSSCRHSGFYMGSGEFTAGGNLAMDWHPIQGRGDILLVASCYGETKKLQPDGPLGSYADFTFPLPAKLLKSCKRRFVYLNKRR